MHLCKFSSVYNTAYWNRIDMLISLVLVYILHPHIVDLISKTTVLLFIHVHQKCMLVMIASTMEYTICVLLTIGAIVGENVLSWFILIHDNDIYNDYGKTWHLHQIEFTESLTGELAFLTFDSSNDYSKVGALIKGLPNFNWHWKEKWNRKESQTLPC